MHSVYGLQTLPILLLFSSTNGKTKEVKILKQRVRDVIDPGRGLGHVDGVSKAKATSTSAPTDKAVSESGPGSTEKEDDGRGHGEEMSAVEEGGDTTVEKGKGKGDDGMRAKKEQCEDCV